MYTIGMKVARAVLGVSLGIALILTSVVRPVMAQDTWCTSTGHGADSADPQVNSALGCIPIKIDSFVGWLMPLIFGIGGGISFLLMVYGFIVVATSGGDPKKAQGGQETVSSAITGLLVCIFGLFILRLIAVDILHIPGIN